MIKIPCSASVMAAALMPPNVQKLMAEGPRRTGSLRDIKHVVMLMMENRSFDHYFGMMAGVRGFGDRRAMTLASGRSVFHQPDPGNPLGYTLPFHLDTFSTSAQALPSTDHSWAVQHEAWNGGRMDNWLPAHRAAAPLIAIYASCLGAMAASAWVSSFPRYRVGLGAVMFAASDLLIFAKLGPLAVSPVPGWLIWPLYFAGQALIAWGAVTTILRWKDDDDLHHRL